MSSLASGLPLGCPNDLSIIAGPKLCQRRIIPPNCLAVDADRSPRSWRQEVFRAFRHLV